VPTVFAELPPGALAVLARKFSRNPHPIYAVFARLAQDFTLPAAKPALPRLGTGEAAGVGAGVARHHLSRWFLTCDDPVALALLAALKPERGVERSGPADHASGGLVLRGTGGDVKSI